MSIFDQLTQTVADYDTLWGAFRESAQVAVDITAAAAARLAGERTRIDERTATLTAQSRDPARPEIVRKLAMQELNRLRELTFAPSEDEAAAFAEAMENARAALRDIMKIRGQLRNLFADASRELDALRAGTLGDQARDTDLAERRLDGEQKSFDYIGRTGRPMGGI